jgi:hypothetical protein
MALSLQQFIDAHKGQPLEVEDSSNRDQCMDLAFGWCDNLGIPHAAIRHLYAYQAFTAPNDTTRQYFDLIAINKNVPSPGDLVVWGTGVGTAGHIAIFVSGDASNFTSFDQNWDTANYHTASGEPYCRLVKHSYNYVIGWLHPRGGNMPSSQDTVDDLAVRLGYNNSLFRQPSDDEIRVYSGKMSQEQFDRALLGSAEHKQIQSDYIVGLRARLEDWESRIADLEKQLADAGVELKPGKYIVK